MRLNPTLPAEAIADAFRKITRLEGATLEARNRVFHRLLADGVTVEDRTDGSIRGAQVRLLDFEIQTTTSGSQSTSSRSSSRTNTIAGRMFVIFVNGLPLAIIELKNAADEEPRTIWNAFQQLQTYQAEIPSLLCPLQRGTIISDGVQAKIGSLAAGWEWFKPGARSPARMLAETHHPELQVIIQGCVRQATISRSGSLLRRI